MTPLGRCAEPTKPPLMAEIVSLCDGKAAIDVSREAKQSDWTVGGPDSGKTPVERLTSESA